MKNVEDVYPLTPVQQGMLFHTLYDPASGMYVENLSWTLKGPLNVPAFERAWQHLIDRHPILRSAFFGEGLDEPLQVVRSEVKVPLERHDWTAAPEPEKEERLTALIKEERRRGFELSKAPLMRLSLVRWADDVHKVVWSHHHMLLDGWSVALILKEIFVLYESLALSGNFELDEIRPYSDYIAWMQQQDRSEAERYWRGALDGFSSPTPMPVDRMQGGLQTASSDFIELEVRLSESATSELKLMARQQQLTLNTVAQGAWALLLSRYSREEDIVFGSIVSGRPADLRGVDSMVGLFLNALPVRVKAASDELLLPWLRRLQAQQFEARRFEFSALADIQRCSSIPGGVQLFESTLAFENFPVDDLLRQQNGSLSVEDFTRHSSKSNYPINVVVQPERELVLQISYDPRLFESSTISRMLGHFANLLEGMASNPSCRLSELEMPSDEERRLLHAWNETGAPYPEDTCIHELFERQVERTPNAVAVEFEGKQLSYRELNCRANQLAHYLKQMGVRPEVRVGVCIDRSIDMIVAILGILKAGGAYVPLDPSYPLDRISLMLEDAGISLLVSLDVLADRIPAFWVQMVYLDSDRELINRQPVDDPRSNVVAENLAYVIYTSGSTGKPKGVMIEHSSVCNLALAQVSAFHISPTSRLLQFASSSFDASVSEVFTALVAGARLCLSPREALMPGPPLSELLERERISVVTLPPGALAAMGERSYPELKTVVVAGEACGGQVVRRWSQGRRFINAYGPTEATVCATMEDEAWRAERGSIGVAMRNVKVYVLDGGMRASGVGVAGEIYVGGEGVGRGYLGRAEQTAERFVPDPYSGVEGARMYRTGDVGRVRGDGRVEYVGRADEQVKVRGYRIELGEVEAALLSHPSVQEAVAAVREDEPGDKRLVAYVVGKSGVEIAQETLRNHLLSKLPDYMVPGAFVQLEALPVSPAGKIDRRNLPAPGSARPLLENSFAPPETPTEAILADIWSQVLGVEEVGIDDNFFTLGGDSIRSVQVLSKAWDAGLAISLQKLFELKTIRKVAEGLEAAGPSAQPAEMGMPFEMIDESDRQKLGDRVEDAYPLSMLQAGMVYHSESRPDTAIYHSIASLHLSAPLNIDALREAAGHLMRRHPALRTCFDMLDFTEPLQLVHKEAEVPLEVIDLSRMSRGEQDDAIADWISRERRRHFDWTRPPLFRLTVHVRSEETFQFTFTAHHSILDGWSDGLALTELARDYMRLLAGEAISDEPPSRASFRDYIALERDALKDDGNRDFWEKELLGTTVAKLPRLPGLQSSGHGVQFGTVEVPISKELSAGLQAVSQYAAVSLKSVLLAAHAKVMSLMSGQSDLVTGLVANCRPERPGGDRIVGLFLNTIPLRARLEGGTWIDLIRQMFETENRSLNHRRYPLAQIQRNAGGEALFETCFNYTHFHLYEEERVAEKFDVLGTTTVAETNLALMAQFSLDPFTSTLQLSLDYDPRELGEEQVRAISNYYASALAALVADPQASYFDAPLITSEEAHKALVEWNDTAVDYARADCIHRLIEAQAELSPESIAVSFEGESINYRELNSRANRVANHLRRFGAGPEALVGLFAERSIEMMVGLLGILKAGAAYVPLSPTEPKQRLSLMIDDTGMQILLTQEALLDLLPETHARVVCLDADWEIIESESEANPESGVTPDNLAYVIYTSGSTGRPKGAMNTHRSVVNRLLWGIERFDISPKDSVLQKTPFSFDVSVWELFSAFMCGARLVMAKPGGHQDSGYLLDIIKRERITMIHFVPSMLEVFLSEPGLGEIDNLRQVLCSGEALTREQVTRLHRELKCELDNLYGPTECAVEVTARRCARGEEGAVPIGKPVANTKIYILDKSKRVVPVGVSGELYIGGEPVGRGYLGRPDRTAESFLPDPYGPAGSRMYATGDEARYLADGEVEYLGRLDHQVKIRGFRIELGEIESALSRHPEVRDSVVVARQSVDGDKYLAAFVVPDGESPSIEELRVFLRRELPDYMVPRAFAFLQALPLTSSGKVDRRALPDAEWSGQNEGRSYEAPRNPVEEIVAGIWADVLSLEQVGIHENFFDLGGHSLLVTKVISRVRSVFDVEIQLMEMIETPTVAAFADLISRALEEESFSQSSAADVG